MSRVPGVIRLGVQNVHSNQGMRYVDGDAPVAMELGAHDQRIIFNPALRIDKIRFEAEEFEERYQVEGAPAEHVRALLDSEHRDRIVALQPDAISIRDGVLTIEVRRFYWGVESAEVEAARSLAASLADRNAQLHEQAAREVAVRALVGQPYRGVIDPAALERATSTRARAVDRLRRIRRSRSLEPLGFVVGLVAGLPFAIGLVVLALKLLRMILQST
jgi:hypothetical protein